ncbi:MAG TPA: hypothetical protein VF101_04305 [Gaiellaceae bacterium]
MPLDSAQLATLIENYREERVYDTRAGIEEATARSGTWEIVLRGVGQRKPQ